MPGDPFGRTAELLAELAGIAEETGDAQAAALLRRELARSRAHTARVVVVGEKKRGKSSLINALLRRPDLLPVDVDIATGVHIAVAHHPEPVARAFTDDDPQGRPIGLEQIAEYGALDPVTATMAHPEVTRLEIGLPEPLLRAGLILVDTPGVGGLVTGHGALTLAALAHADALLFVVSGASELTASECRFLERAAERIANVVFVLTQTDKYPRWRDTLARSQELIREHAPRFADMPWYAVSSRLRLDAHRARLAGDLDTAAVREERSGFGPLEKALGERIAGAAQALRERNCRYVARRVLDKLVADQQDRLRSLVHDPALQAAITAGRDRLEALQAEDASWRSHLAEGFKRLDRDLNRAYQRAITDFQATAERRLAQAGPEEAAEVVRDLEAGVRALWEELESTARHGADRIIRKLAADFAADGIDALQVCVPYPARLEDLPAFERTQLAEDTSAIAYVERYAPGVSMAYLLSHLVGVGGATAGGGLLASLTGPPGLLLAAGGLFGHAMYKRRRVREENARLRTDLQRHLQAVLRQIHAEVPPAVQDGLEQLLRAVEQAVSARIAERRAELEAELAEHLAALQRAEAELAPQREAVQAKLTRLRELAERLTG